MNENNPYRLAPCVVLTAAVIGTREAYEAAMAILPTARNWDNDLPAPPSDYDYYDTRTTDIEHGA
jgi:hypothetical protein